MAPAARGRTGAPADAGCHRPCRRHARRAPAAAERHGRQPRARALYESLGFAEYGMEPEGLCVNGVLHDERLMTLRLAGD